jgi:hypothetical protein
MRFFSSLITGSLPVRTGHYAVTASYAFFGFNENDAIIAPGACAGGAYSNACRLAAVIAQHGQYKLPYRRKFTGLTYDHAVPEYSWREKMFCFTAQGAGITANAFL